MEEATKAGLLDLVARAVEAGWSHRRAWRELEVGERRAWRWTQRRAAGELGDRTPGGKPMHGLLDDEVAEVVALYHEWGEVDRSHRSWRTGAPTPIGCGSRPPRCDASWLLRGYICMARPGVESSDVVYERMRGWA